MLLERQGLIAPLCVIKDRFYAISMLEIASIAFSAWQRSAVSCYQHDEGRECYSSTSMRIKDIHVIGNWIMALNRF